MNLRPLLLLLFSGLACLSCGNRRTQQSCRMDAEYVVARSEGAPTSLHLMRLNQDTSVLFWSADRSTWCVPLDNGGTRRAVPLRVQDSTDAGVPTEPPIFWPDLRQPVLEARAISAVQLSDHLIVAAILTRAGAVYVASININSWTVMKLRRLSDAGAFSESISAAATDNGLLIGWQNTLEERSRIALVALHPETLDVLHSEMMDQESGVFGPAIASAESNAMIVFTELSTEGDRSSGKVMAGRLRPDLTVETPEQIARIGLYDSSASIRALPNGFGVAFRDDADNDDELEFYYASLGLDGKVINAPHRISRADGPTGPRISQSTEHIYSAQIRSYQRNLLVGFNRFDARGQKTGGEFQVYADKSDFLMADLDAAGPKVLLVYAEASDRYGRILSATVSCK